MTNRNLPSHGEEHHYDLQGEAEEPDQAQQQSENNIEAGDDIWSVSGSCIHRHHVQPRIKLNVSKEGLFPIPFKYMDFVRRTNTTLEVLMESRVERRWLPDAVEAVDLFFPVLAIERETSRWIRVVHGRLT